MKQLTRSISMFLVCVMSLCLLTACGGGGGGGSAAVPTDNASIVRAMGCSSDIKENEEITEYCTTDLAYRVKYALGQITLTQYNNTMLPLASKLESSLAAQGISKSHILSVVANGTDINDAIATCKEYARNAGYSLADMKQYGLARGFFTDPETGESACIILVIFTF